MLIINGEKIIPSIHWSPYNGVFTLYISGRHICHSPLYFEVLSEYEHYLLMCGIPSREVEKQSAILRFGAGGAFKTSTISIKKVIFNPPATIVFWSDGTKTIVKAENEPFDREKGLAMAICKRLKGNKGSYFETFKWWCHRESEYEPLDPKPQKSTFCNPDPTVKKENEMNKEED